MYDPLISAEELIRLISNPMKRKKMVIFDCRYDLNDPDRGREDYERLHILGARYAHLSEDLSGEATGSNGRHPMPDRERLRYWAGEQGVEPHKPVIVYDDAGGGMAAARLWMLLRWLGHQDVRLLDGGFEAYLSVEGPATEAVPTMFPKPVYPEAEPLVEVLDFEAVRRLVAEDKGNKLIDARARDRYTGNVSMMDRRAGHIPGARSRPYTDGLDFGRLKPADEQGVEFYTDDVHYCGSGVTSCVNMIAAVLKGVERPKIYVGSWSEWQARSNLIETGAGADAAMIDDVAIEIPLPEDFDDSTEVGSDVDDEGAGVFEVAIERARRQQE